MSKSSRRRSKNAHKNTGKKKKIKPEPNRSKTTKKKAKKTISEKTIEALKVAGWKKCPYGKGLAFMRGKHGIMSVAGIKGMWIMYDTTIPAEHAQHFYRIDGNKGAAYVIVKSEEWAAQLLTESMCMDMIHVLIEFEKRELANPATSPFYDTAQRKQLRSPMKDKEHANKIMNRLEVRGLIDARRTRSTHIGRALLAAYYKIVEADTRDHPCSAIAVCVFTR